MLFNKSRAIEYMKRFELDALVATSPVNITYFTDFYCGIDSKFKDYMIVPGASSRLCQAYAVFPLEGEPALVVSMGSVFAVNAADLWVDDLFLVGDDPMDSSLPPGPMSGDAARFFKLHNSSQHYSTATEALLSILNGRDLTGARIGLEKEDLPDDEKQTILRQLPDATIKDCTNLIRMIRMVKSPEELKRMSRAAEISEQAGMESLSLAQPGRQIADLVQHYRASVAAKGAEFEHFYYGMYGMGIAAEPDYILNENDVLFVDFGCIYKHYFSDTGTTLAMRELSGDLLARRTALFDSMTTAAQTLCPGVKSSTVRDVMWETLEANGITAVFPHGHGFGLEVRDYPIIVADNGLRIRDDCIDVPSDLPLEENMVINLEAAVFMPGIGSVHIEQSFVVTSTGSRPLVSQDRSQAVTPVGLSL